MYIVYLLNNPWFESLRKLRIFSFPKYPKRFCGWVCGGCSSGGKEAGPKADDSPPSSADVRNYCSHWCMYPTTCRHWCMYIPHNLQTLMHVPHNLQTLMHVPNWTLHCTSLYFAGHQNSLRWKGRSNESIDAVSSRVSWILVFMAASAEGILKRLLVSSVDTTASLIISLKAVWFLQNQ
jgi:hypothetical protein